MLLHYNCIPEAGRPGLGIHVGFPGEVGGSRKELMKTFHVLGATRNDCVSNSGGKQYLLLHPTAHLAPHPLHLQFVVSFPDQPSPELELPNSQLVCSEFAKTVFLDPASWLMGFNFARCGPNTTY